VSKSNFEIILIRHGGLLKKSKLGKIKFKFLL